MKIKPHDFRRGIGDLVFCQECGIRAGELRDAQGNLIGCVERGALANLRGAVRELKGVIEAHDVELESCDRDGNTYCDCLDRAIQKIDKILD